MPVTASTRRRKSLSQPSLTALPHRKPPHYRSSIPTPSQALGAAPRLLLMLLTSLLLQSPPQPAARALTFAPHIGPDPRESAVAVVSGTSCSCASRGCPSAGMTVPATSTELNRATARCLGCTMARPRPHASRCGRPGCLTPSRRPPPISTRQRNSTQRSPCELKPQATANGGGSSRGGGRAGDRWKEGLSWKRG